MGRQSLVRRTSSLRLGDAVDAWVVSLVVVEVAVVLGVALVWLRGAGTTVCLWSLVVTAGPPLAALLLPPAKRPRATHGWAFLLYFFRLVGARRLASCCRARLYGFTRARFTAKYESVDSAVVGGTASGEGLVLRATLVTPREKKGPYPTVLMRTPYGRHAEFGQTILAEHGYAVLVQDTRGRFGSDGQFVPVQTEKEDGAATIAWIKQQPWYNGKLAVYGISYLGFTAWACVGGDQGAEVDAIVPVVSQSRVRSAVFRKGGAVSLELVVLWLYLVLRLLANMKRPLDLIRNFVSGWSEGVVAKAYMHLPLEDLDDILLGKRVEFFQQAIAHPEETGPFWKDANVLCDMTTVPVPPCHIITGWYDFFLLEALQDYSRAVDAREKTHPQPEGHGTGVRLTIGSFSHWGIATPSVQRLMFHCLLSHLHEHLGGGVEGADRGGTGSHEDLLFLESTDPHAPVQIALLGTDSSWCGLESWPPPSCSKPLYLTSDADLVWRSLPQDMDHRDVRPRHRRAHSCSFTYDPLNPTPSLGGPSFDLLNSGARDQGPVESRSDVLTFTTQPLLEPLRVIGTVTMEAFVTSSSPETDFVARLCLVSATGVSTNLAEGLSHVSTKTSSSDTPLQVHIDVGPTAFEAQPGEALRLSVCSAAHPRWLRCTGIDQSIPLGKRPLPPNCPPHEQRVWTGGGYPSRILLPVVSPLLSA